LAGLAGLVSGLALVLLELAFFLAFGDQPERVAAATGAWLILLEMSLLAAFLSLLALAGLYARQAEQSGGLGLAGFVLAALGTALNIGFLWAGTYVVPALTSAAPEFLDQVASEPPGIVAAGFISTHLLFAVGWIVFGFASLRAKVLPAPATWLMMAGALLALVLAIAGAPLGEVVFGLGLAWLGQQLRSEAGERAGAA
jgi:hypothetical protein